MRSINLFLTTLIVAVVAPNSHGKLSLPEMVTKQAINNIRYIDSNGKYTYYQRRSGSLLLSTNFSSDTVLEGKPGNNYQISDSLDGSWIAIQEISNYHQNNNIRHENKIYFSKLGDKKAKEIGEGIAPRFHLNGKWLSYFKPRSGRIIVKRMGEIEKDITIDIRNKVNPYFTPQVAILNEEEILYTDLNEEGYSAIIYYNMLTKDIRTFLKTQTPGSKLEICANDMDIFIGEFDQVMRDGPSQIWSATKSTLKKKENLQTIYQGYSGDIGNIVCMNKSKDIYFIKGNSVQSDLVRLNSTNKQITQITNEGDVLQFIRMDQQVLIPYQGKIHIASGTNYDLNNNLSEKTEVDDAK